MNASFEPSIGIWYAGERGTGAFLVIERDESSGLIHLQATDGRRVRMTFESWSRRPLTRAQSSMGLVDERFEWDEPAIG
jgi:hypothetical protein